MAIKGLHHIHLRVPDREASRAFVRDFGLIEVVEAGSKVYLRTSGPSAYQLILEQADAPGLAAIALVVDERADLDAAVRDHGASAPAPLEGPGGGEQVTLKDPEGNAVMLIHGVEGREADEMRPAMTVNYGHDKPRRGSPQINAPLGAPQLLRLGHIGLFVKDMEACDEWYRGVLGLLPSDIMYAGAPQNVIARFYRINRGDEWVDHHTIALFGMGKSDLHHISFEVQDSEVQFMAHRWMARHRHDAVWGVGRHSKGSHVFDVWRDPSGYRFETFSDTDLCTADRKPDIFPVHEAEMDVWTDRPFEAYFA